MKTPEKIKKGLEICNTPRGRCEDCPYKGDCEEQPGHDALAYIEQLEETISLMKIQMRGDCGCCMHGKDGNMTTCNKCLTSKGYHPLWEYEGLPEVKRHE